jgi:hypothetical protein
MADSIAINFAKQLRAIAECFSIYFGTLTCNLMKSSSDELIRLSEIEKDYELLKSDLISNEKKISLLHEQVSTMELHKAKNVWYWEGNGTDELDSMGNSMVVVIRADQLRGLMKC